MAMAIATTMIADHARPAVVGGKPTVTAIRRERVGREA
jgi:hypothetical protein